MFCALFPECEIKVRLKLSGAIVYNFRQIYHHPGWCSVPAGKKGFTHTGRENDFFLVSYVVLIALKETCTMMLKEGKNEFTGLTIYYIL
jgi:hypothetical protein